MSDPRMSSPNPSAPYFARESTNSSSPFPENNNSSDQLSMESYSTQLQERAMRCIKASKKLPQDLAFHAAASPEFAAHLRDLRANAVADTNKLIQFICGSSASPNTAVPQFEDLEELVEGIESSEMAEVMDRLFEKADLFLEEARTARLRASETTVAPAETTITMSSSSTFVSKKSAIATVSSAQLEHRLKYAAHLMKPQLQFEETIDNSNTPFVPKLRYKHNAKVPLQLKSSETPQTIPLHFRSHLQSLGFDGNAEQSSYPHPYEHEIQTLEHPPAFFQSRQEILFASLDKTPLTWVETEEQLRELATILDTQTEIAVDLEAHDYRTFLGLVCLMQVSTRDEDFLVDTLALRSHMHLLNSSFTNPNILKVLHGADSDNQWLQRDFGVYLVNLFDTYHASHVLNFPQHSLAYLLKHYAGVTLDKKYQLADWRIRPLPEEMARYAREDTHYLLYVYDRMREELLQHPFPLPIQPLQEGQVPGPLKYSDDPQASLKETLRRSALTSLKTYQKPLFSDNDYHMVLARKFGHHAFNHVELTLFKHLFRWRDEMAREKDESTHYIMPIFLLFRLATRIAGDGVATQHAILTCCDGIGSQAESMRANTDEIVRVLERALATSMESSGEGEMRALEDFKKMEEERKRERMLPRHTRFTEELEVNADVASPAVVEPVTSVENVVEDEVTMTMQVQKVQVEDSVKPLSVPVAVLKKASALFNDESSEEESSDEEETDDDENGTEGDGEEITAESKQERIRADLIATLSHDGRLHQVERVVGAEEHMEDATSSASYMIERSVTYNLPNDDVSGSVQGNAEANDAQPEEDIIILSEKKRQKRNLDPEQVSGSRARDTKKKPRTKSTDKEEKPPASPTEEIIPLTLDELKTLTSTSDISRIGDGSVSNKLVREARAVKGGDMTEQEFDPYSTLQQDPRLKKKARKANVRGKSGMRSMSFRK